MTKAVWRLCTLALALVCTPWAAGTEAAPLLVPAPASVSVSVSVLEQRMQRFHDGSLRGFALAELPDSGVQIYRDSDFKDLADTGANVVRLPIVLRRCGSAARYCWPEADVRYAERVLVHGERLGFKVVLVLVVLPGGEQSEHWGRPELLADIVQHAGRVAQRLRHHTALQAYDLLNEPVVPAAAQAGIRTAQAQWFELAQALAQMLRAADPDTPLMVEPTPWALPDGFWRTPLLRGLPGVVYSFHFYAPHRFTHQGLPGYPDPQSYPGHGWHRQRLSQELADARAFAARHGVPLFVGEFSCVRWAPGGSCPRYLADAVGLFEAEGWGWAYHCWRCYQGWDAEVPADGPTHAAANVAVGRPAAAAAGHLPAARRPDSASFLVLKAALRRNPAAPAAQR